MDVYFLIAAVLSFIVALVHSILGEYLIFRRMRKGGIIPTEGGSRLKERHVRILWASWHIVTIFGWGFGAILLKLSSSQSIASIQVFMVNTIAASMFISSLMVLISTKARHPGWLGLLLIAIFSWLGIYNA